MSNICLYCKSPHIGIVNKESFDIFSMQTMHCKQCGKAWKDFEGIDNDTNSPIISIQRLPSSNNKGAESGKDSN
jgi:hypothetical protein